MRRIETILLLALIVSVLCIGCQGEKIPENRNEKTPTETIHPTKSRSQVGKSDIPKKPIEDYCKVIKRNDNSYTIILYDKNKEIVHQEKVTKEPYINLEDENVIRVTNSLGSPLNYTYFYDVMSSQISPIYENALLIENDKIIFMKDNVLIVSNISNKDLYYKEIKRDFSQTAVPSSAIVSIKFVEPTKLELNYLEGKDFTEKSETIDLSKL